MQPGPIYFRTPRKCGIFGVCDEGSDNQLFYLIDESTIASKGANATISYLHHYLESHPSTAADLVLHADNCS